MRVVFDTNVIIDAVASREPFAKDAQMLLEKAAENAFQGFLTANSLTDIYYVVRRNLSEEEACHILYVLLLSLEIIGVNSNECWRALDLKIGDYEDSLLVICAESVAADLIVSRDTGLLTAKLSIPVYSPEALVTSGMFSGE